MSIYKDCDIRGIYGVEFEADEMLFIGRALGRRLGGRRIVVAGDVRVSTPLIKEKLLLGLMDEGADIIDVGIVPTPVAYFAKSRACFDAYALAIVTASHNPAKYNGIKLMFGEYPPVPSEIFAIEAEVKEAMQAGMDSKTILSSNPGEVCAESGTEPGAGTCDVHIDATSASSEYRYEKADVEERYAAYIKTLVRGGNGLKVVLDIGNGTTSGIAPRLYRAMGYDVVELFGEADGSFPNRNPNPADFKNLDAVRAKVVETGADFGVAFDGDGDRAVFIDDKGRAVINEKALIMLTEHATGVEYVTPDDNGSECSNCVGRDSAGSDSVDSGSVGSDSVGRGSATHPQFSVVYDQKCSRIVPSAIEAMGGRAILERSGHAFIKKRFLENGSILAGEISGHFFFSELGHDDGVYAGLCMGDFIAKSRKQSIKEAGDIIGLSNLSDRIPDPHISPDLRYRVPYGKMNEVLEKLKCHYEALGMPISTYDGVRVQLPDGWLLVRKSVTEEAMTAKIEAGDETRIDEIIKELKENYFEGN